MKKQKRVTGKQAGNLRVKLGMNQSQFWGKLGVTQSAGSRYESGRTIPLPVSRLYYLAYGDTPFLALAYLRSCTFGDLMRNGK